MPLIRFDAVSLAFGEQKILHEADFALEGGERVCLIGRNGAGKSSTLKLITGEIEPDDGKIERDPALSFGILDQSELDRALATLRRDPPRLVFYVPDLPYNTAYTRAIMEHVRQSYERIEGAGPFEVYRYRR